MSQKLTARKSFGSDNHAGTHPAVMQAIIEANQGDAIAYGADPWTERATERLRDLFRTTGDVFFVFNGSGANVLGLSLLIRRYEAIICAENAHIAVDECGSSERLLGTKLLTVPAPEGKITPDQIAPMLAGRGDDHRAQPGAVCITQSTEFGTCYSLAEIKEISEFCAANSLRLFIDGARLANAVAHLDCSIAELASHVDALSFGGTKNGAMLAEALIVMRPELVEATQYLRKQQTQLASKMRFVSAQFNALLDDDLWLRNARHANAMATRLALGLADVPAISVVQAVQADAVFARMEPRHIQALQKEWFFHVWDEATSVVRLMTAFDTKEADVDAFLATARAITGP